MAHCLLLLPPFVRLEDGPAGAVDGLVEALHLVQPDLLVEAELEAEVGLRLGGLVRVGVATA